MYPNFQAKGLLPDRTLESFYYLKTPKVQFPIIWKFFPGKKQSEVISQFRREESLRSKDRAKKSLVFFRSVFFI